MNKKDFNEQLDFFNGKNQSTQSYAIVTLLCLEAYNKGLRARDVDKSTITNRIPPTTVLTASKEQVEEFKRLYYAYDKPVISTFVKKAWDKIRGRK